MARKIAICLASCRPNSYKVWSILWKPYFDKHKVNVYVAWDTDERIPKHGKSITFIKRKQFPDYVPTGTSACRSAAVKKAYKDKHDIYIFLDDDVYPPKDGTDIIAEYIRGFEHTPHNPGTFDVGHRFLNPRSYTRGFPYKDRQITPVVAQYGGWDNVPDLDARDTAKYTPPPEDFTFKRKIEVVPKHQGFTGCFMNCAFKHEVVPALYHLYQGTDRCGYDRFDDIWASLMLKRLCDHFGWSILINGYATCYHDRASNNIKSIFQEEYGHTFNEGLWDKLIRQPIPEELEFKYAYFLLANQLPQTQIDKAEEWITQL